MKNLIYKIKNRLFRFSNEAAKLKKPSYEELRKYSSFQKSRDNKFILSFGAGRCGQNWSAKIFNSHSNWIGTCERFREFESLYRYISYFKLPIYKEGIYKLLELASKRDMANYQNTFIASPYFSFGVEELCNRLNPDYLFFHIRNPVNSVESFYRKGWYSNFDALINKQSPSVDISNDISRALSRIIPNNEFLEDWLKLTRIGKITWFWATINKAVYTDFKKLTKINKFFIKLEDINQNYEIYERLTNKFNFEKKMTKKQFFNVINKAPNKSLIKRYEFKNWSDLEKKEYDYILKKIFPDYDNIKTNLK